eukprot:CAMPEP_0178438430 /NCGR_PEP_ID=MMETSP0689_2-20121128/35588_1 /TAXON_ID=160604 /ORGANISM="Amphidinium massartii, Strain CS-259" /LENGTH=410 /DNA_ID=CAMNT_0020060831 /DNA_START=132 /DNA_END=1364 /DNA_ORIENTATION=+
MPVSAAAVRRPASISVPASARGDGQAAPPRHVIQVEPPPAVASATASHYPGEACPQATRRSGSPPVTVTRILKQPGSLQSSQRQCSPAPPPQGGDNQQQLRIDEIVTKLHRSLEQKVQDSVDQAVQAMRVEEQGRLEACFTDITQAVLKEVEETLRHGIQEEVRVQTKAMFRHEMRGLIACFAFGSEETAFDNNDQFRELRAGLSRFEHRLASQSLLDTVRTSLSSKQDEFAKRLTALEAQGSSVTDDLDASQRTQLDVTVEAQQELTESAEGGRRKLRPPAVESAVSRMEALHENVKQELACQRSLIESLADSLERINLKTVVPQPGPGTGDMDGCIFWPESKVAVAAPSKDHHNHAAMTAARLRTGSDTLAPSMAKRRSSRSDSKDKDSLSARRAGSEAMAKSCSLPS